MRVLTGLLVGASLIAATPVLAQGVYLKGPDVSVGVGRGDGYDRDRDYRRDYDGPRGGTYGYRDYDRRYDRDCRTVRVERADGGERVIRRCR